MNTFSQHFRRQILSFILLGVFGLVAQAQGEPPSQKIYRIMPVGDSITEGGANFCSYRFPLWEKLFTAGYLIEYVGSRTSDSRIGPLHHEGYSGKNAEYIAAQLKTTFAENPADVVLIHSGHNHNYSEMPVPGIVAATESMIKTVRKVNPKVVVLLAKVIPSGLPKYQYIPKLNLELEKLAVRLNTAGQPVLIVDQAEGFHWQTDMIGDHVHPNAVGAEKIAARWFAALTNVMATPGQSFHPQIITYKKISGTELSLHLFRPAASVAGQLHPAIVFFFGGGWQVGTPIQFYPECAHFAQEGFVAISADYRIASVNHTTPFESVADGKSVIRWVRQHAAELGIDPEHIVAAGASAGGQVAAATGIVPGLDEPGEDLKISSRPNALALWYPAVDNGPGGAGYELVKNRFREISPLLNIDSRTPPTIVFLGTRDDLVPVQTGMEFKRRIEQAGGHCELKLFAGAGHPIYEYRRGNSPYRGEILAEADAFLAANGFSTPSGARDAGYKIESAQTP